MRKHGLFKIKTLYKTVFAIAASLLLTTMVQDVNTFAEILPTYELTEETEGIDAFEVEVRTEKLNVRIGWGTDFEKLTYNGENVVLHKGDKIAGMAKGKDKKGNEWYEVRWTDNGVEMHGYVYAPYTTLTGEKAVNIPTPTPTPLPTPTNTPTPVPTNTPTPAPTATPVPVKEENKQFSAGGTIGIVLLILAIAAACYFLLFKNKKTGPSEAADDKIKRLKHATERAEIVERERKLYGEKDGKRSETHQKSVTDEFDDDYEMNAKPMPDEERKALETAVREKEELRRTFDSLKYNDVVIHKYFGEGVVVDNADVNNVEVRFNDGEVRYINKDSAAAKKIMVKL